MRQYYDIHDPQPHPNDPDTVDVERVYLIDFDTVSPKQWKTLEGIFQAMPGSYRESSMTWFGDSEDKAPFLAASVELPGLHVFGALLTSDWESWTKLFEAALDVSGLPLREVE